MKPPIFISSFADDLIAYIDFKARTGKTGHSRIYYLRHFDTWATRHSITKLDRGAVEGWVADELTHCSTHRSWMSYIRDFGRWMRIHRDPSAHVLGDEWKAGIVHSTPYLMSSTDIEAFFTATRTVPAHSPWAWQATAFFLLMHSAGLRTREVRALTPANVDFNDRHIMIATSKSGRERKLPLTDAVMGILDSCHRRSRSQFPNRQRFFVSSTGAGLSASSIGVMFNRIWDHAGLARPAGGPRPRSYDFRHHFAYANIERWMREGTDVNTMLPYLSAYMGHAGIDSTLYYVHTSPDFMDSYAELAGKTANTVIPEPDAR
ncbi:MULTISPECIES: tyrosine-type recombinase/integrase [Brevibacterium]|uniref:Integrase n=2 Tax=Brevibacterium TaxID=1696 RepID=A0A368M9L4_BREAU|nr:MULTISPECIES: tyrosine-type recombinase/integrase [Brevibacterium]AZL04288.1 integrase [Brevibacterium aurantiacum]AZT91841.1 integrase [Brevibacterium aurantiacum]AZT91856.1 integrase [Brevibacterium aurantiacum]AZT92732.1 integrase [Brevibacterium aurantiacum]AZT92741.1 integrase [Brevibacterium aurantiacum]